MAGLTQRLSLYLRTVRWLRLTQLGWFIYRRVRGVINPPAVPAETSRDAVAATAFVSTPQPDHAELRFLNVSAPADPAAIDWHPADKSRLWRYNLHYFDFLQWDVLPAEFKPAYIDSWLAANPVGCEDAWEPYTVSLRIVNWIKYCNTLTEVPAAWQDSLTNQANWLAHNLEHHILANHYYKNAKALVFAGVWLDGDLGQRLLRQGTHMFLQETAEQILADGGHYERAPMYHCIVLEDLLDVLNLMQAHPALFGDADSARVHDVALRAARWLDEVSTADGRIPLFNDSAHGIAPPVSVLLDYAERAAGYERLAPPRQPARVAQPDSGYFGYRHENDSLLIDCGRIGPGYQPGHTHCDMLSYELYVDGKPLIIDAGVHGYEGDDTRAYLRSTAAHNTVVFEDAEQSEIWGTFRVARRAEPLRPQLSQIEDGHLRFTGAHNGYERLPQKVVHNRQIDAELGRAWEITDQLAGQGTGTAESFVHFAPGIDLEQGDDGTVSVLRAGRRIARVTVYEGCAQRVEEGYVAPQFGLREAAPVLVLQRSGGLPLRLGYRIERIPPEMA